MKLTITISTDNAAFAGDTEKEVKRILANLVKRPMFLDFINADRLSTLYDSNGNTVGQVTITE